MPIATPIFAFKGRGIIAPSPVTATTCPKVQCRTTRSLCSGAGQNDFSAYCLFNALRPYSSSTPVTTRTCSLWTMPILRQLSQPSDHNLVIIIRIPACGKPQQPWQHPAGRIIIAISRGKSVHFRGIHRIILSSGFIIFGKQPNPQPTPAYSSFTIMILLMNS